MAGIDLIIFDFDGVLVDSETMGCQIWSDVFAKHGMTVSAQDIMEKYTGKTGTLICSLVEQEYGYHIPEGFLDEVNETTESIMAKELKTVAGVLETMPVLPVPICIASGSRPKRLNMCLDVTGLRRFFPPQTVFSSHFVKNGKPAPDLFFYASDKMGVPAENCLVIEDSSSGIIGAKAAGMKVFGFVGASHCTPERGRQLTESGAELLFNDFTQLPKLLKA
ncbi:MAG: HAD family phosphatase [Alphaproteobacteria bacterium]|nr:HAD family phosphatase [Alphaproteobacteria bacterium]